MRSTIRRAVSVAAALLAIGAGTAPAQADHFMSVCDNGDPGLPLYSSTHTIPGVGDVEIRIQATQDAWISFDAPGTGLDTLVGIDSGNIGVGDTKAVCVRAPIAGNHHIGAITRTEPGYLGFTVVLQLCTWNGEPAHTGTSVNCSILLGETGVLLNPLAPLFSCVYVAGNQQNPGCP